MKKSRRVGAKTNLAKRTSRKATQVTPASAPKTVTFDDLRVDIKSAHHDVFVTTPTSHRRSRIYRFVVNKRDGAYDAAPFELKADGLNYEKFGERKLRGLVEQDSKSGAAFATLPVKEEPSSVAGSCYLINRQLLNYNTVWTRAPWNDSPSDLQKRGRFVKRVVKEEAPNSEPRFLLALNTGEVLDIQVTRSAGDAPEMSAAVLDLHANPDVWRLLRNGCVAGVAVHDDGTKLPLFSLASLHTKRSTGRRNLTTHITGTLDYKWRPGSNIKVKFTDYDTQECYGWKRAKAIAAIEKLAKSWVKGVNLRIVFDQAKVNPVGDDYDMLVSLEPLVKPEVGGTPAQRGLVPGKKRAEGVFFPKSLLGCYAEREERNVPTMFLGYPENLRDPFDTDGKVIAPHSYFDSRAFRHIVLHEFGHALGLPHLYQHPGLTRSPFAKLSGPSRAIAAQLTKQVGPPFDVQYVDQDLRNRWPDAKYSEWPEITKGLSYAEALADWLETSVMVGIPARALLSKENALLPLRDSLGPTDREWIKLLYPK